MRSARCIAYAFKDSSDSSVGPLPMLSQGKTESAFLDASSYLYINEALTVRWLVGWLVGPLSSNLMK